MEVKRPEQDAEDRSLFRDVCMKYGDGRFEGEPLWKELYEAAFFELDSKLLLTNILDAQKAMGERAWTLLRENGHNHSEKEALTRAYITLDDLKRIHQTADRTLKDA